MPPRKIHTRIRNHGDVLFWCFFFLMISSWSIVDLFSTNIQRNRQDGGGGGGGGSGWIPSVSADDSYNSFSQDDYDEYVREVLEEGQEDSDSHENSYYHEDSYYEKQAKEQEEILDRQRREEERVQQEKADRLAFEREQAFEAELKRMDADQQKRAKKQKKQDARIVSSILKAADRNDLYRVLGIRNWNLAFPARTIGLSKFSFQIPELVLKQTSMKDIRKAYRSRAMSVHPDKNKDGHAQDAFIAVEEAATVLSDPVQRQEYDTKWQILRYEKRELQLAIVRNVKNSVLGAMRRSLKVFRKILGPFATPVLILGFLIL